MSASITIQEVGSTPNYFPFAGERSGTFKLIGKAEVAVHLVEAAINDIGEEIEEKARELAPRGKTGELKAHPVERTDAKVGIVTGTHSIVSPGSAPRFSARGARGRFIGASSSPGDVFVQQELTVPSEPQHAVWVHDGTGVYGKTGHPIVPTEKPNLIFHWMGRIWKLPEVAGQKAQPYLRDAYVIINGEYISRRMDTLRVEIRSLT